MPGFMTIMQRILQKGIVDIMAINGRKRIVILLCIVFLASFTTALATNSTELGSLNQEWQKNQEFALAEPAPWNQDELKQVLDVEDPRSVAAYWVWSVTRLVDDYDDGIDMMKYLFADQLENDFWAGVTDVYYEGGYTGDAGWNTSYNDRLTSKDYKWMPRAYFEGAIPQNGFNPNRPLTIRLLYDEAKTESVNLQTQQYLRQNIVYQVKSDFGSVSIVVSKFDGCERWYVNNRDSAAALFYDQRIPYSNDTVDLIINTPNDTSTEEEHRNRYGEYLEEPLPSPPPSQGLSNPFIDILEDSYYYEAVVWAYKNGVTTGTSEVTFDPMDTCTRGQVVTFLWRAAGKPEPSSTYNRFQDVNENNYYYTAVLWAVEQGITNGTSENTFSPDQICSSAHIVTFLYRAMGIGKNGWGEESRNWAVNAGLIEKTGLSINSEEACPRGAVVYFLFNCFAKSKVSYVIGEECSKEQFLDIRTIPCDSKEDAFALLEWIRDYISTNQFLLVSDLYEKLDISPIPAEAYHYCWTSASNFGFGKDWDFYYVGTQPPYELIEIVG